MHILILTHWYPPEPALLIQELGQSLQELGHDVTVLTGFPNYPTGKLYSGYRLRLWQKEVVAGVPVVRVPLYPNHGRSGLKRAINYLSFAISAMLLGAFTVSKPDVMFVYHPPLTVGLPAYILSRLWRIPFVFQVQDMWPETLQATGMLSNQRILSVVGNIAKWVYQKAAAICVISPGFRANLLLKGVPLDKIHVISNWVDTNTYYPERPDPQMAEELGLRGRFNIMFAGNIGEAQAIGTILDAAELLKDEQNIQFVIVGDGIALESLQSSANTRDLRNVQFLGRYPTSSMPKLYALADVLLIHLKDDPLFRITIPHKTFAYMATGKPILAAVDGDCADVVLGANAGIAAPSEDPQKMALAIRELYGMNAAQLEDYGHNGLEAVRTQYNRDNLIRNIEYTLLQAVDSVG